MPGSSGYFLRGWVTYAYAAKDQELGVPAETLEAHFFASPNPPPAPHGHRCKTKRPPPISHSPPPASRGPTGGTDDKPVGTVWIALASPTGIDTRKFIFPGNRQQIRLRAAQMALALLRWKLLGIQPPSDSGADAPSSRTLKFVCISVHPWLIYSPCAVLVEIELSAFNICTAPSIRAPASCCRLRVAIVPATFPVDVTSTRCVPITVPITRPAITISDACRDPRKPAPDGSTRIIPQVTIRVRTESPRTTISSRIRCLWHAVQRVLIARAATRRDSPHCGQSITRVVGACRASGPGA